MNALLRILGYPFEPLGRTLRLYNRRSFGKDMIAGLTVAVVEVPQAMAYAYIAGVPPQYGLYTSIVMGLAAALFTSSNHVATGPTNTQSLLIAATVTRGAQQLGYPLGGDLYLQMVLGLTLIKGLIQFAFAAGGMGQLVRYVSQSVIVGFAAGAGVLIAIGQLPAFLGVDLSSVATAPLAGVPGQLQRIVPHLSEINPRAVAIGCIALALIVLARSVNRLMPGPLIAVVGTAGIVYIAGWSAADIGLVGEIPRALPQFQVPAIGWREAELLFTGALALALLGMIETVAIGKTIAAQTGERVDPNREFFAQGMANFVGAFLQAIPGSGSFTRSALSHEAGGRTRLSSVFGAIFVALIFLAFTPAARFIPLASLAAILFIVAYGLIDWRYIFRVVRTSRADAVVCLSTFLATLIAPLQYAIYIGVFLNLAVYIRHASQLHMNEMVRSDAGPFVERPIQNRAGERKIIFLQLEGDLFFGVADELQDRLTEIANSGVQVMILRLKRTHWIDATVLQVFENFLRSYQARGGNVVLCGVKPELIATFRSFGLIKLIGENNVFETSFGVFTSAKRAIERARELVGSSIDAEHLSDITNENEAWAYQI